MAKVGVLLSGSGVLDGSEIHEAVLTLYFLDRQGVEIVCMAPDMPQMHVVNHITGQEVKGETRNVLVESARISRGKIKDLKGVKARDLDALILPGGYGAAKNLCDFAVKGRQCTIHPEVTRLIKEILTEGKPLGAMCIAPALLAGVFHEMPDLRARLTIGTDMETGQVIEDLGSDHVARNVNEILIDEKHGIVTTPAYMLAGRISEAASGIEKLVIKVLEMVKTGVRA